MLDVGYDGQEIYKAVNIGFFGRKFREICGNAESPYGDAGTGLIVSDILSKLTIDKKLLQK